MLNRKAVALLSGGLDSAIATKLVLEQGVEVVGLNFHSPFCTCDSRVPGSGCSAVNFANKLGIPIKVLPKGDEYLQVVKNPRFGYGKNLNPCIDCRIFIMKKAKRLAEEIGASFIVTGEVLGQRPKSQMLRALRIIEQESGLEGLVVRPLSAKRLPPTIPEKEGILDRQRFLDITGRRRNIQVELGRKFRLIEQYCAGGGCLLTDKGFSRRLMDYFDHVDEPRMRDMKYLRVGRHFRFDGTKIICGRDEKENTYITALARDEDVLMEVKGVVGPRTLVQAPYTRNALEFAAMVTVRYSDSDSRVNEISVLKSPEGLDDFIYTLGEPFDVDVLDDFRV